MSDTNLSSIAKVLNDLKDLEVKVVAHHIYFGKLKALLVKTCRELPDKPRPDTSLAELIFELGKLGTPVQMDVVQTTAQLNVHQLTLKEQAGHAFARALRDRCESEKVNFRYLDGGWAVGPFGVRESPDKKALVLRYAKQVVERDLPFDAERLVARVNELAKVLLEPTGDLDALGADVREAMRVAVARQGSSASTPELRVDLPAVYREMVFIRQGRSKPASKTTFKDYLLPRFIVQLKSLLQSDENVHASRRLKLEPAVIENSRNSSKSLYIPGDLAEGCGEGTYYQALVLLPSV
jgi:hypothetical protein